MKTRTIFLITVLAVMFGGTSIALADSHEDTPPEDNTVFVADVSVENETTYIKYHVCSLNAEDEVAAADCADVLENDLPEFTDDTFWSEIEVTPNENDELNHGSFVSAFARGYEGDGGKGCILRFVAQSDWGKEGFDIEGDDVLIQAETFCASNKPGDAEDDGNRPPWAGIGKKAWEAEQSGTTSNAGGPPPWAGNKGGPNSDD